MSPTSGREGEIEVTARIPALPHVTEARAVLRIDPALATPRAWFADLHVHSEDTVGINNTEYNLTYGRDVAGLDVLGYTANDFNITENELEHRRRPDPQPAHRMASSSASRAPNGAATPAPAAITTSSSCTATSPSSRSTAPANRRARSSGTRR